jgi:hypothetical protein
MLLTIRKLLKAANLRSIQAICHGTYGLSITLQFSRISEVRPRSSKSLCTLVALHHMMLSGHATMLNLIFENPTRRGYALNGAVMNFLP